MAGKNEFNYIVRGIRKAGGFRPIERLCPDDFFLVAEPNQPKAVSIGNAFVEVFGEAADCKRTSD